MGRGTASPVGALSQGRGASLHGTALFLTILWNYGHASGRDTNMWNVQPHHIARATKPRSIPEDSHTLVFFTAFTPVRMAQAFLPISC